MTVRALPNRTPHLLETHWRLPGKNRRHAELWPQAAIDRRVPTRACPGCCWQKALTRSQPETTYCVIDERRGKGACNSPLRITIKYDTFGLVLRVHECLTADGRNPFREWLVTLDVAVRARVQARVLRFELGNLGDNKNVGGGVWEARLTLGPGYRLYFGKDGETVVVLLLGGAKGRQRRDIQRAQAFWHDYQDRKRHGKTK
jgi:putative addiction module killer protein